MKSTWPPRLSYYFLMCEAHDPPMGNIVDLASSIINLRLIGNLNSLWFLVKLTNLIYLCAIACLRRHEEWKWQSVLDGAFGSS